MHGYNAWQLIVKHDYEDSSPLPVMASIRTIRPDICPRLFAAMASKKRPSGVSQQEENTLSCWISSSMTRSNCCLYQSKHPSQYLISNMTPIRVPADPATEALIQKVIVEELPGQVELPETAVQFSDASTAFQHVQQYAFANGFAVVETQWDPQQQR